MRCPPLGNSVELQPHLTIAHGSAIMLFAQGIFRDQHGYVPKRHKTA